MLVLGLNVSNISLNLVSYLKYDSYLYSKQLKRVKRGNC